MNQEKLESAKNLFFIALGVDIAVTALVLTSDFWAIGVIKDIRAGGTAGESDYGTADFWASFSKVTLLTVVGVGWSLARWLGACYEFAKGQLKATGFVHERWKVWGWLVPFMNIFKPYQVVSEIYKAGSSDVIGDGWKKTPASGLLLTWWIFWYIAHLVLWTLSKAAFRAAFRDDLTFNQILDNYYGSVAACVISLIVAALWFLVAGNLTRRLLDRQRVGVAPVLHGQVVPVSQPVPPRNPAPTLAGTSSPAPTQLSASQAAGTTSVANASPAQFVNQTQSPTSMPLNASTEEDFWAAAMTEVETGQRRAGVWAKAFAECDGDETKAKVAYLKARVQQLTDGANALAAQQEVARLEAIEQAQREALATKQEIKRLAAQFESTGAISREELKFLINRGPMAWLVKLRVFDQGATLLHLCAKNQMIEEVNALLLAGADPSSSNKMGELPVSMTNNSLILQLFNGLEVSQEQLKVLINPPVGLCPSCDDVISLEVQTCPTCQAMVGPSSAWHVRCLDDVEMVLELKSIYLKKKPTVDQVKYLVAASKRDSSLISLVDSSKYEATLLHWCAHYGLMEQAQLLLAIGANAKAKNSQDRMPFEWCESNELRPLLKAAANPPTVGPNVNTKPDLGDGFRSPIFLMFLVACAIAVYLGVLSSHS